jgi:acyl carrier protein
MILDKIAAVITKVVNCKLEDVRPDTELETLGIDSLKTISLIFELEEAFDIEIPTEAITSIVTVRDIMDKLNDIHA